MNKRNLAWILVPALAFGLAACEVEDNTPETGAGTDVSIQSEENGIPAGSDSANVDVQTEDSESAVPGVDVQAQSESDTQSETTSEADDQAEDSQPAQAQTQGNAGASS